MRYMDFQRKDQRISNKQLLNAALPSVTQLSVPAERPAASPLTPSRNMNSESYTYDFSSDGFDDSSVPVDRDSILVLDTNSKNADSLLKVELAKSYIKKCSLLILQGLDACDFEDIADDYIIEWKDAFVPTITSREIKETFDLINGWAVNKLKKILVITDSENLLSELRDYLV